MKKLQAINIELMPDLKVGKWVHSYESKAKPKKKKKISDVYPFF